MNVSGETAAGQVRAPQRPDRLNAAQPRLAPAPGDFARAMMRALSRAEEETDEDEAASGLALGVSKGQGDGGDGAVAPPSKLARLGAQADQAALASASAPAPPAPFAPQSLVLRLPGEGAMSAVAVTRSAQGGLTVNLAGPVFVGRRTTEALGDLREKLRARGVDLADLLVTEDAEAREQEA